MKVNWNKVAVVMKYLLAIMGTIFGATVVQNCAPRILS
jgi:hypothetical protein